MKETIMISVILPVYNVERYLRKCLDSLLQQVYKNFEVIAVNDGSTDTSLIILEEYKNKFQHYLIINQENQGLSEARNQGLKYAQGKYIYFLDSDDYIIPEMFLNLVDLAESNQLDLIKFDARPFCDIPNSNISMSNYDTKDTLIENKLYTREEYVQSVKKKFMPPVWLYFIKASIIFENNLAFKKGLLHEDELFTVQLLKHCKRIMYDSHRYFQRRYRVNSIMTNSINSNPKSYSSKIEIIKIFSELQKNEINKTNFNLFLQKRKNCLFTTLFFYKNKPKIETLKLLKTEKVQCDLRTFLREMKKILR